MPQVWQVWLLAFEDGIEEPVCVSGSRLGLLIAGEVRECFGEFFEGCVCSVHVRLLGFWHGETHLRGTQVGLALGCSSGRRLSSTFGRVAFREGLLDVVNPTSRVGVGSLLHVSTSRP